MYVSIYEASYSLDPRDSKSKTFSLSTLTRVVSQPYHAPPAMVCSASSLGGLEPAFMYVCLYVCIYVWYDLGIQLEIVLACLSVWKPTP